MKLIIGMMGVIGVLFGVVLLQVLCDMLEVEIYLVMLKWVKIIIELEMFWMVCEVVVLVDFFYSLVDQVVIILFGLFCIDGMIVIFCSMKMFVGICVGYVEGLVGCVVDVVFKEGCKLVLVLWEMLFSMIYLENMLVLFCMGVVMVLFMLVYYNYLEMVDDIINYIVIWVLDQFGFDYYKVCCWNGLCMVE